MAKHSPELAQSVVDSGALDALVICLEEFDPGVKESAAWALGYIARHNAGQWTQVLSCPAIEQYYTDVNIDLIVHVIEVKLHSMAILEPSLYHSNHPPSHRALSVCG